MSLLEPYWKTFAYCYASGTRLNPTLSGLGPPTAEKSHFAPFSDVIHRSLSVWESFYEVIECVGTFLSANEERGKKNTANEERGNVFISQ